MKYQSALLFILVSSFNNALIITVNGAEYDFTIRVDGGVVDCYFQNVSSSLYATLEIDYQVIEGGNLDISFQLIDPQEKPLASDHQRMDNLVRINVTNVLGDYKLCFDNTFSQQSKLIFFQIALEDQSGNSDDLQYEQLAAGNLISQMQESIAEIRASCAKIKINLNNAEGHQSTLRALEARDRMLMESSCERVNFWSFTALIIMLIVGIAQVFTIRTLFIDDSKFGKFIRGGKR